MSLGSLVMILAGGQVCRAGVNAYQADLGLSLPELLARTTASMQLKSFDIQHMNNSTLGEKTEATTEILSDV